MHANVSNTCVSEVIEKDGRGGVTFVVRISFRHEHKHVCVVIRQVVEHLSAFRTETEATRHPSVAHARQQIIECSRVLRDNM